MKPNLRTLFVSLLTALAVAPVGWGLRGADDRGAEPRGADGSAPTLERAEALFAEGSYALARELYQRLQQSDRPAAEVRWIEFRIADAGWRAAAATANSDPTEIDRARLALETLVRDVARSEERDRVWAEVQESLGDYWWTREGSPNWGQAASHYLQALDWWAGSSDLEPARERYLAIVRRAARPPGVGPDYVYGSYGNVLPPELLEDALAISRRPEDRAHLQFMIAMSRRWQSGDGGAIRRTREAFERAIASCAGTEWYDDALYHYAEWLSRTGRVTRLPQGGLRTEPDYAGALALYRQLLREFVKGQTRYFDPAQNQVAAITGSSLGVAVSNIFLPGSIVRYHLQWRNVREIRLSLFPVDLTRALSLSGERSSPGWIDSLDPAGIAPERSWTYATGDAGDHVPGSETIDLDAPLASGAYLLEARAEGKSARELVLVTRGALVLKSSGRQALAFVCDAVDGSPRENAEVVLWIRSYRDRSWGWSRREARSDRDGLARFELPEADGQLELFAVSRSSADQAFTAGQGFRSPMPREAWRLYVFTDRPAYRPGERVGWKVVARRFGADGYSTPSRETLGYRIQDPRGTRLAEGRLELNDFGSAWDALDLGTELPLGEYRVEFLDASDRTIGGALLFRMEEYKLPEFAVRVETPVDESGRPKSFRVGDEVEVEVVAEYYFGGPVAGASVELLVQQRPLQVQWSPPREFPWFYDETTQPGFGPWIGGQTIRQESLTTDADGRARFRFESPHDSSQDYEFTVEARVTDASRREVRGSGTIRASRQRYFAFVEAEHRIYRPGDEVRVELRALDANRQPLAAEGRLRVTRERYVEIWIDPAGREVSGGELERLRGRHGRFPPPASLPREVGWRLQRSGYEQQEILSRVVRTGADGEAELALPVEREGFYKIRWEGDAEEPWPVTAETAIWVADRETTEVGYRTGGIEILIDRDTVRAGRTAPVILSSSVPDVWVLFSVGGEELFDYRVVHLEGRVKWIELPIEERHIPNVFLEAVMVRDAELHFDGREIVVPPVENFLTVTVEPDAEEHRPGEEGALLVTTLDHAGNPVAAEVALALVDESVFAIQQDYAGDPRQFFFGEKRSNRVQTRASFQQRPYARLFPQQPLDDLVAKDETERFRADAPMRQSFAKAGRAEGDVVAEAAISDLRVRPPTAPAPAEQAGGMGIVQVRSDFRATAAWRPDLVTGADGRARLPFRYPDSVTGWTAVARAAGRGNRFGIGDATTRTRKPLIVRLQAPRFFVAGDEVVLSALLNNNTDAALAVTTTLTAEGLELLGTLRDGELLADPVARVEVPAHGETRIDWKASARQPGTARLTVAARSDRHDDAMAREYPVHEHGIDKLLVRSGKVRGDEVRVRLDLPQERRVGSTELTVQVTPSMAVTMLDALPYLIDYPYGCTEQTMSRFLPAVVVRRTLESLGLDRAEITGRIFGGIERGHEAATHPDGERDLRRLDGMVRAGLDRLYDFQHGDGGWAWWKEGDSDHFMTAYVVWGLGLAREAGVPIDDRALRRGVAFLDRELVEREAEPDLQAFMLHALSSEAAGTGRKPSEFQQAAFDNLWRQRDRLNAYTRALLALSAHHRRDDERARILLRNLENGVRRDDAPNRSVIVSGSGGSGAERLGTAHWGEDGVYRRWSDGGVEATAFALRALLAVDPGHPLIEPVANWLIRNRRGAQWSNTRDTAMVLLALTDYLRTSGELETSLDYELRVNGEKIAEANVRPGEILGPPSRFSIPDHLVRDTNEIRILRTGGDGSIYFSAEARFFSLEEPVTPAGNEIFVRRRYYRLVPRATLLKGYVQERQPLEDLGRVTSGERVEVVLTVEGKNDYEYLIFEDLKPAGLEAVALRSGEPLQAREVKSGSVDRPDGSREDADYTGRVRRVFQELRDRQVALFVDKLPEGVWEIRYELRAEVPGAFHALPPVGHAMYVPEVRANGAEIRLTVGD